MLLCELQVLHALASGDFQSYKLVSDSCVCCPFLKPGLWTVEESEIPGGGGEIDRKSIATACKAATEAVFRNYELELTYLSWETERSG